MHMVHWLPAAGSWVVKYNINGWFKRGDGFRQMEGGYTCKDVEICTTDIIIVPARPGPREPGLSG